MTSNKNRKSAPKKVGPNRINFSPVVKRTVASRSGYECSFPNCSALTIGPGRGDNLISITGVAAHIYSAAPSGPRGQGFLSQFELSAPSNAIWLCETHAKLIDNNRGTDYPPSVLVSYKGLHETAIMRRHTGLSAPLGWFHEMRVLNGPVFRTPTTVRFGKFTILSGPNSTGKTALWEWLSLASTSMWGMNRWRRRFGTYPPLDIQITYFTPIETVVRIAMGENGEVSYSFNHSPVPYIPLQTRFVVVKHPKDASLSDSEKEEWRTWGDTRRIARSFQIDEMELVNILPLVGDSERFVQKVWVEEAEPLESDEDDDEDEPPRNKIKVKLRSHGDFHPSFGMLSVSIRARARLTWLQQQG